MSDDIQKQWEQDVADYGDNAYLMWKLTYKDRYSPKLDRNDDIAHHLRLKPEYPIVTRKDSAALPFDLEQAKNGAVVEICGLQGWVKCNSKTFEKRKYPLIQLDGISVSVHNLHMKYPPKVTSDRD